MRRAALLMLLAAPALPGAAAAHDLFLELESHRLAARTPVAIALVNGTFGVSDNVITRDRMVDVSLVGPANRREHIAEELWRDEGVTTLLDLTTGVPGSYVLGVSTAPRMIEMDAKKFHGYLKHDGVLDVLEARTAAGLLDQPARERYSKHVKTVLRVGGEASGAFDAVLGYPVEVVPLRDPLQLELGEELPVRILRDRVPLANQLVYASHERFHGHDEEGAHIEAFRGRTDENGLVSVPLDASGRWYVRLIHMTEAPEADVDYESLWATLTFEIQDRRPASPLIALMAASFAAGLVALVALVAGRTVTGGASPLP
ncbi:MAG: DUF4198 domain-containing protein [Planctomycetota bacterium]